MQTTKDILMGIDWSIIKINNSLVVTSGGFDPMHIGHLRMLQDIHDIEYDRAPYIVCLVNDSKFLEQKKGYEFMPLDDRIKLIDALDLCNLVVGWETINGDTTIKEFIRHARPNYLIKGGDYSLNNPVQETGACYEVNCKIIYGVGGKKVQNSSLLVDKILQRKLT